VFYKHFLLHGLNISLAISGNPNGIASSFRLFWLSLNASYVMEFFLQTLVKRRYMSQSTLLWLQKLLMTEASIVAVYVLQHVNIVIAMISMVMNFINRRRYHDTVNTIIILIAVYWWYEMINDPTPYTHCMMHSGGRVCVTESPVVAPRPTYYT
jgi:hypothetical protein